MHMSEGHITGLASMAALAASAPRKERCARDIRHGRHFKDIAARARRASREDASTRAPRLVWLMRAFSKERHYRRAQLDEMRVDSFIEYYAASAFPSLYAANTRLMTCGIY